MMVVMMLKFPLCCVPRLGAVFVFRREMKKKADMNAPPNPENAYQDQPPLSGIAARIRLLELSIRSLRSVGVCCTDLVLEVQRLRSRRRVNQSLSGSFS